MEIKILQVFYGSDGLPYKDKERKVHFPIVGSGFQGASQTTKIRFYFGELGDSGTTWVATAKLPNGKLGSKILSVYNDSTLDEYYAELSLSSFYFQYKGDVFFTLQGYDGGITYTYDSVTELYTITGTPVIQSSGSIKMTVNYATQFVGSGEEENTTIQDILALVGTKVTKTDVPNILYGTNGGGSQTTVPYTQGLIESTVPLRSASGEVNVATTGSNSYAAVNLNYLSTNYSYLRDYISVVSGALVLDSNDKTYAVSPLDSADYTLATRDWVEDVVLSAISNVYKPQGSASVGELNSMTKTQAMNGYVYNMTNSGTLTNYDSSTLQVHEGDNVVFLWRNGTWEWDDLTGIVDCYTKDETDALLSAKQNTLVSGTNIKTINNQSILGSGNIDIQSGGDSVTPNETLVGGETKLFSLKIDDTTYDLDNGYEKLTNKVTSLSGSSTDTQYPSAKAVYDNLQNVREVAEGKCKTYILDYSLTFSAIRGISGNIYTVYSFDGTEWVDVSNEVKNNDPTITGLTIKNSVFNSQDDYVSTTNLAENCIIFGKNVASGSVFYLVQCNKLDDLMKTGDIILVVQTEVPDRWCSSDTTYYKLETSKVDLTNYVTTNTNQTVGGTKTFSNGFKIGDKIMVYYAGSGISVIDTSTTPPTPLFAINEDKTTYLYGNVRLAGNSKTISIGTSSSKLLKEVFTDKVTDENGSYSSANTFNVINASDITNNTLTQAQYDLITNGKPTLIKGTLLGLYNPLVLSINSGGAYGYMVASRGSDEFELVGLDINTSTKVLSKSHATSNMMRLNNIYQINNKALPAYPSSPSTPQALIYDTDNSLKYVDTHKEWYGTQAQYDALSTYDSNTLYYIEEE